MSCILILLSLYSYVCFQKKWTTEILILCLLSLLFLVPFLSTKSQNINETPIKTYSLKMFGPVNLSYRTILNLRKNYVRENKYTRKLIFDHCAKINTREINRFQMREIKSARKLVRIRYGLQTFSYMSPKIWNLVPTEMKQITTLNEFKAKIKIWKLENYSCRLCRTYLPQIGFIT